MIRPAVESSATTASLDAPWLGSADDVFDVVVSLSTANDSCGTDSSARSRLSIESSRSVANL